MNISFSATKEQFRARRKHVTRRLDRSLRLYHKKPGDILTGIEKAQGLKKGEHIVPMGDIIVLETGREPLDHIITRPTRPVPLAISKWYGHPVSELELEGFPHINGLDFVRMFEAMNKCCAETPVTRILFDYVDMEES